MGMIRKTGPGMQMGAAGASLPHNMPHNDENSFEDGNDPFGDTPFTESLEIESAIKNAFGPDFSKLETITPPDPDAPIQKLQFGKGVTMTLLNFDKMDSPAPTPQPIPIPIAPTTVPATPQEAVQMTDLVESFTFPNGATIYLKNGQLHRDNGPAIEFPGGMGSVFFQHGRLHRDNGPAISWPYQEDCQWFKHGIKISSTYQTQDNIKLLRMKMFNGKLKSNKPQD